MTDTTARRLTITPPETVDGAHTLVWTVQIDRGDLHDNDLLLDELCDRFRTEVAGLLSRQHASRELDQFLAACRFSLADLRALDSRAGVTAARNELAWQLRRAGWPLKKIGRLLHRHHSTIVAAIQKHEADQQVAQVRAELAGVA
jgi:hypothetical protein